MSEYTHTPNTICFKDIEKNDFNLSASQYNKVIIPNYKDRYFLDASINL